MWLQLADELHCTAGLLGSPGLRRAASEGGMASTDRQRWARVPPALAWKRPGLPSYWVPVLERHPEGVEKLPGYVWLDTRGKRTHVWVAHLEFRD